MRREQILTGRRRTHLAWLAGFAFLATMSGFGQAKPDPWLILVSGESAPINAHTTRQDLVRAYGAPNVVDQDIDVGEGETQPGTVVFPKDPARLIEIVWRDPDKKTQPSFAQIQGSTSRWKAAHSVSLGTSLKEMEHLNGRSFTLAGFGWDYSGTVLSWEKGALAEELDGGHGRVIVRLDSPSNGQAPDADQSQVLGDRDFSSGNPVMQKLNPKAYQILWMFPTSTQQ